MTESHHRPYHIVLVAGENSGDRLGAALMNALRQRDMPFEMSGLGGALMAAQGLDSIFPMEDVAVMGLVEIAARLPKLTRRIRDMAQHIIRLQPDMVILIDSPEFTHRVAKKIRPHCRKTRIVNYVAPSVWAWRRKRARAMRHYIDHILSVLPFETDFFARSGGVACTYVGHPAIDDIGQSGQAKLANAFRKKYNIDKKEKVIALLPGSRMSEARRLMPIFSDTLALMGDALADCRLFIPAVPHLRDFIDAQSQNFSWPKNVSAGSANVSVNIIDSTDEERLGLFHAGHAALIASGTVSLELALAGLPMIVAYRSDWILEYIVPRIARVPSVVLPNLILDKPLIPEFITDRCKPALLAPAFAALIQNERGIRDLQKEGLKTVQAAMAIESGAPSEEAANVICHLLASGT